MRAPTLALLLAGCGSATPGVAPGQSDAGAATASGSDPAPRSGSDLDHDAGVPTAPDGGLLGTGRATPPLLPQGPGHIIFRHPDGAWRRVLAMPGAPLEDLSAKMSKISSGKDGYLDTSKDGAWLIASGSRFGCGTEACLAIFAGDVGAGALLKLDGKAVDTAPARPVVSSGENVVVFAHTGPHPMDLFAVTHHGDSWSAPVLLTSSSPFSHHHDAAISSDGSRVAFDCGQEPYGAAPTAICEVATDGTGFHKVIDPADGSDHGARHALHHPDYAPDGSVVFEADWPSETIWKRPANGGPVVELSGPSYSNDNSPCVLPDGRVVSLWLGREGNTGDAHEIKVMDADGANPRMLVTGIDVIDEGIACGN